MTDVGTWINTQLGNPPRPPRYEPLSSARNSKKRATTKATVAGGRKGSPSIAVRKGPTNSNSSAIVLSGPKTGIAVRKTGSTKKSTSTSKKSTSSSSRGGGGSGASPPAAPPPPNPLDVLQTQLSGQLDTLFKGLGTTQTGIRDDYDARSAALLSQLEGYYAGADTQNKQSQTRSQQMLDELAGRVGMTGVTGTVDDLERKQAAERINQLNSTNQAASNAGFDLIRNNYRDFLGDKVSQANASGVMAQVGLMDAINALKAEQAAAAGSGGGGGGGGRGRGGGGSGGGSSTSAAETASGLKRPAMPEAPMPAGTWNLSGADVPNWQGGRVGSPSIAVKRYPGISNPSRPGMTRGGFPITSKKTTTAKKSTPPPAKSVKVVKGYGRTGSPSAKAGGFNRKVTVATRTKAQSKKDKR